MPLVVAYCISIFKAALQAICRASPLHIRYFFRISVIPLLNPRTILQSILLFHASHHESNGTIPRHLFYVTESSRTIQMTFCDLNGKLCHRSPVYLEHSKTTLRSLYITIFCNIESNFSFVFNHLKHQSVPHNNPKNSLGF